MVDDLTVKLMSLYLVFGWRVFTKNSEETFDYSLQSNLFGELIFF